MAFDDQPFQEEGEAGAPRPGYAQLLGALAGVDLADLRGRVNRHLAEREVTFGTRPFVVDPIPRLITPGEWEELAAGLAQRADALNRFLLDAYGERRIVEAGVVSGEAIQEAEGFEPDLLGRLPAGSPPAAIVGFDVVREPSGRFLVLEDNVRTPSGFEYALAARAALTANLPPGCPVPRPVEPITGELLLAVIKAAAPDGRDDPSIVILTDGPSNVAFSEHSRAAARIGVPLVTLDQLAPSEDELYLELDGGQRRRVDVLYRRCDEDRVRDEHGELTEVARAVLRPWLTGNLGLVNAFGNGVADDKLIHGHVDDFIRFYLGQEPIVRSVPTYDFPRPSGEVETVQRLREHVVKPRHGHGGAGVVIGPQATDRELDELAGEVNRRPQSYISQPKISLSSHPTVIDDRIEPRHVDLRVFAFCTAQITLMPGGLSRVALEKDKLIVNSSQSGGGKDTWVL
ncbi:MAG TPA: circularly permuted type 2 ATP-grasp protein [Solirubrobacteraceae bacterium]